jgi:hypothetical protein
MRMRTLLVASGALAISVMIAAQAGGVFAAGKGRDKHCDEGQGYLPGYGSPRCRMEAPPPPGQRQKVIYGRRPNAIPPHGGSGVPAFTYGRSYEEE